MDTPQNEQNNAQQTNMGTQQSGGDAKTMIIVGYVFPILFFLNLNGQARFHGNQQLVLILAGVAAFILNMILAFIPILGWLISIVITIFLIVLWIMGIINGANGTMKKLPVIGGITILK